MKFLFLIIFVALAVGIIFVSVSEPNVDQQTISKTIPFDQIEID